MESWFTLARDMGVAVTCLAGMSLTLYRAMIWLGTNVVKPVADRHIKFLDDLTLAYKAQGITMELLAQHQARSGDKLERALDRLEETLKGINEVRSAITRMDIHADRVVVHQAKSPDPG